MTSPRRQYTEDLYRRFGYLATWLPGVPVELGDVGVMRGAGFDRVTTLERLGVSFETRPDASTDDYLYMTEGAVSVALSAKAEAPIPQISIADGSAEATVELSRANAVLFIVRDARSISVEDQQDLGRQILEMRSAGEWNDDYVVMTEVLEAQSGIILISSGPGARVELTARAGLADVLQLADAALGVHVRLSRNIHTQIIASSGLSPLFRARRVRRRRLGLGGTFFRGTESEWVELRPPEMSFDE